ncbi:MAG: hydrogenase accessory protein HypB, partial [Varibaculum cambriense]|nr:hydrogenase accessory protein HypB [Varibaculum cambriense]
MGRFHRHDDGTVHSHDHGDHTHHHDHGDYVADPEVIGDHSGYDTEKERIEILEDIYAENDHLAEHNRQAFAEHNVKV